MINAQQETKKGEREMFKKYRLIVALLIIGLVSAGFGQSVGASAKVDDTERKNDKFVFHSKIDRDYYKEIESFLAKCLAKWNITWDKGDVKVPEQPKKDPVVHEPKEEPAENAPEQVEKPKEHSSDKVEQPTQKQEVEQSTQPKEEVTDNQNQYDELGQLNQYEWQVLELTNQERAKYGLKALQIDYELSRVAREKSRDMQINNYFDHNSPVYGSPFDMMRAYGINYRSAGENIARGQRTPEEVVNAWMNSPGHRENILNNSFTHIGIGYVDQGNYWTQQFITK